jgi:UDP-N-acetylmuramyl pentapeptide phosphotransferase/UDP-N-acetylglucosamine-1-phosphate transferase
LDLTVNDEPTISWSTGSPAILVGAALFTALLILLLRPVLRRYAMARPNVRSSHKTPTLQGGGIAVLATVLIISYAALCFLPSHTAAALRLPIISAAIVLIAGVGVIADVHAENFLSRLLLQAVAVAAVVVALPTELRVLPILPLAVERIALIICGLWFVNLVNFMDGLDWMTVAEVVPVSGALAAIGLFGLLPPLAAVVSLALCGAMIGFAYFNRPVAKLFLGDVGSLPIGLVLGWLLVLLAGNGGRAAAILLPLYYLADSTITLIRRALNGERVWQAHRSHFYQRATDRGFTVMNVVARVFTVNLVLTGLALATVLVPSRLTDIGALTLGFALVASLLVALSRGRRIK